MSERLVEQARRGDADAFVALIEERQVAMTRVATAILRDPADVADALQETLVSLWRELPSLRSVDAFPAWADRVLVNACRLVLRRRGRRRLREIALPGVERAGGGAMGPAAGRSAGFDTNVAERDAFDRAFETLDADARAILVLHHLEGQPIAAIAVALGIPHGTAKSRLFTARRRLEEALAREERDESGRDLATESRR
ncbi:MAG TPA: RNA polymerase sigma factor [Candidatus Limnocylindrales bacterium]|nr:RNA polymerase sigma factor [Candidatus Limnocylindrales bacterium]